MFLRWAHPAGLLEGTRYNCKIPCKEGDGAGGEADPTIETEVEGKRKGSEDSMLLAM